MLIKCVLFLAAVSIVPAFAAQAESVINPGHSGHWIDLEHPGQGIIIEVLPIQQKLALDWFSFSAGAPGNQPVTAQRWFTGLGAYSIDQADLTLFNTHGGKFAQAGEVITVPTGTASFRTISCTAAVLNYQFNNGLVGTLNLVRLTPAHLCLALSGQSLFPEFTLFKAQAEAEFEDGMSVSCELNYIMEVELHSLDGLSRTYAGALGGEARRTVVDSTGGGIGFLADAFGPVEVQITGNTIDIQYTFDLPDRVPPDEDSRFWNHQNSFSGEIASDGAISGSWRCAPVDTRGDESLFASGTWTLEPVASSPIRLGDIAGQ